MITVAELRQVLIRYRPGAEVRLWCPHEGDLGGVAAVGAESRDPAGAVVYLLLDED